MEHDFFDMYLEEMRDIVPLDRDEMDSVLEGTARGDAGARSRLVEGCLREVLEMVREYGDSELPLSDLVQEANTALMLAAIEYDGSEPWNELMTRRVKEGVELALEEQRTENQIEETMAARVNVLQTVSQVLAKELGRDIDISVQYAESFSDAAKGKAIATKMYSDGCGVIYHAAGGSGTGVIEAAKEADKWVIGVDRDQAYLAPENVLTSALKLVGKAVKEVSIEAMEGKTIGGQTLTFGLKEDCVGIPEEHGNMADGVYEDTLKVAESIKNGELVPPTTKETYEAFTAE